MPGRVATTLLRWLGRLFHLGVLAVLFVFSAYLSFSLFVRSGVTRTPDVSGLSQPEAEAVLLDHGLEARASEVKARYSETVPEGRVLDQSPNPGSLVKRNKAVRITLSLGPERATMPDLRGQALQAAEVALRAAGLEPGVSLSVFRAGADPGTVLDQQPPPGRPVPKDTVVELLLAEDGGEPAFLMPDLVYRRIEPVRGFFESAGFRLAGVREEPYDGVSEGVILRQSPPAGFPVTRRDAVSLVVAAAQSSASP